MSSKKCPQCGAEAPAIARTCAECGLSFFGVRYTSRTEAINPVVEAVPSGPRSQAILIAGIAGGAVILFLITGYLVYPAFFAVQREAQVQTAIAKGDATKAGVSDKNREAAKAALNAIGELESVTSVGTNFQQYTSTLQSAKIKYDAAIRDLKPIDQAEFAILSELEESMLCHVDAKDAWNQFIQEGSQYGFLSAQNYRVRALSSKYGYSTSDPQFGYHNSTVLQSIWAKASEKFRAAEAKLK